MKTKIYFIAVFLLAGIHVGQAQEWGYVSTLTGELMRKIWTQGLDTVYIVGESGLIARSTDQGETWDKQHFPTGAALNDIIFTDHYTGFAAGEQGTILKTTNAGDTWEQIAIEISSHINAIAATGLDNIWAVGDNSLILHSTDAGETWNQENILPENNIQLSDIAFRENLGYFTGNYAIVYKTENGGVTWGKQIVHSYPITDFFEIYNYARSISMLENKTYLMVGEELYLTEDQVNWISAFDDNTDRMVSYGNPFFLNDNEGYVSLADLFTGGNNGMLVIQKTLNCGKYWETIEEKRECCSRDIVSNPSKIKMVNDALGYAIFSQVLLKIPALIPTEVKEIRNNVKSITIQINREELVLESESSPIRSVEFFDTFGKKWIDKKWQMPVYKINININNLFESIYLIRVTHEDGTISVEKYVI